MIIYTCAKCKKEFRNPDEWSEEDATKELNKNFPGFPKESCYIVCDDCFNEMFISQSNEGS